MVIFVEVLILDIMLGAIAGDLAAWTYENDREKFYSSLTSERAELSVFGQTALDAAMTLAGFGMPRLLPAGDYDRDHLHNSLSAIQLAQVSWSDIPDELIEQSVEFRYVDKDAFYFRKYLPQIIRALSNGRSKKEVREYGCLGEFFALMREWDWEHCEQGLMTYLMRAWHCFFNAWDFTSAIHSAARWEGVDRHFLCSLTGVIAEAMYGCEYRLIKKKYGSNWYHVLEYPESVRYDIKRIWDWQWPRRVFFPKNSSLTNVERHTWKPFKSVQEGRYISSELFPKILQAFHPDWENRFGFYLDDGWVYCYRSAHILCRFHLVETGVGYFFMMDIQKCADDDVADDEMVEMGLEAALRSAESVGSGAMYAAGD